MMTAHNTHYSMHKIKIFYVRFYSNFSIEIIGVEKSEQILESHEPNSPAVRRKIQRTMRAKVKRFYTLQLHVSQILLHTKQYVRRIINQ